MIELHLVFVLCGSIFNAWVNLMTLGQSLTFIVWPDKGLDFQGLSSVNYKVK